MAPVSVNIGGTWKNASGVFTNVGGVWKTATGMPVNIGGVWKTVSLGAGHWIFNARTVRYFMWSMSICTGLQDATSFVVTDPLNGVRYLGRVSSDGTLTAQTSLGGASYAGGNSAILADGYGNTYLGVPNGASGRFLEIMKFDASFNRTWRVTDGRTPAGVLPLLSLDPTTGTINYFDGGNESTSDRPKRTTIALDGTVTTLQNCLRQGSGNPISMSNRQAFTPGTISQNGQPYYILGRAWEGTSKGGWTTWQVIGTTTFASGTYPALVNPSPYSGAFTIKGIVVDPSVPGYAPSVPYVLHSNGFFKTNSTLSSVPWERHSVSDASLVFQKIAVDLSGNIYLVGQQSSNTAGLVVKYDSSGTLLWQRNLSCSSLTQPRVNVHDISFASNGDMMLGVEMTSNNSDNGYAYVMRLPSDGSKTGTYTVGTQTVTYSASSLTWTSVAVALGNWMTSVGYGLNWTNGTPYTSLNAWSPTTAKVALP